MKTMAPGLQPVDLVVELARQLQTLLVNAALGDTALDRWPRAERWSPAEDVAEGAGVDDHRQVEHRLDPGFVAAADQFEDR